MNTSICIPTRNRPEDLRLCLDAIRASSVPPGEIVVSDDSTDDRSRVLVATEYPEVKYVAGPRRGLGPNRNAAIAAATGDWILFLDDDARLGAGFLAVLTPLVETAGNRKVIFTGVERQERGIVPPQDQDFLGFQTRPYPPGGRVNTVVINAALFPAALLKSHAFDPRLIYGYDEVDIASRARAAGYEIVYEPKAVNLHFPSPINRDYYRPHTEAARIYVTCKKYLLLERSPVKAAVFLVVSLGHSVAHQLRRNGLAGLSEAFRVHRNAWRQLAEWRAETRAAGDKQPEQALRSAGLLGQRPE